MLNAPEVLTCSPAISGKFREPIEGTHYFNGLCHQEKLLRVVYSSVVQAQMYSV